MKKTWPNTKKPPKPKSGSKGSVRTFFADLGPGLITGAADDDPSGISTYSVTGAAFGYMTLWTALFSFPLMAAVQLMCARLGMVTGRGLAGVVRRNYKRPILWGACAVLAGSAAYAVSEAKLWRGTLEDRPNLARNFYAVVAVSMMVGLALNFVGFNAVKMLFYAAVRNGALAAPLIVLVVLLTSNPKIMGERVNSRSLRYLGWAAAAVMTAATVGMIMTINS